MSRHEILKFTRLLLYIARYKFCMKLFNVKLLDDFHNYLLIHHHYKAFTINSCNKNGSIYILS